MTSASGPNSDAVQQQLYRYAQDLQELMEQQSALQQRYKVMLQTMGPGEECADLLLNTLLPSFDFYIVTNGQGVMLHASRLAERLLSATLQTYIGKPLVDVVAAEGVPVVQLLLDGFSQGNSDQGIFQRTLTLKGASRSDCNPMHEAFVMQVIKREKFEIYWLLVDAGKESVLDASTRILCGADGDDGLMITDHAGSIREVNRAFTRICGYEASEVIGQNARVLSSGLQGADFYRGFWSQLVEKGSWTGELFNRRKNGHIYFEWMSIRAVMNDRSEAVAYWAAFSDMSTRMSEHRELSQLAFHDPLTGLPNRRLLETRLTQAVSDAIETNTSFCLLLIDLNKFKCINDDYGHEVGDLVLQTTSSRLQSVVRRGDTVARIGGDEFVVVLPNVATRADAEAIADTISFSLELPLTEAGHKWNIGASIGGACFPMDGSDISSLLKHADAAMYGAKRFGIPVSFYESGVPADAPVLARNASDQP